jgi:hypothetical protein
MLTRDYEKNINKCNDRSTKREGEEYDLHFVIDLDTVIPSL